MITPLDLSNFSSSTDSELDSDLKFNSQMPLDESELHFMLKSPSGINEINNIEHMQENNLIR